LSFKPDRIRVLFIGESPPAAAGAFFYRADSRLYRYTKRAFAAIFGEQCGDGIDFLNFFKSRGCYLDDLSLAPVNTVDERLRRQAREDEVHPLAERMQSYNPEVIVVVMIAIADHVRRSAEIVGLNSVPFYSVPFPAQGNEKRYVNELTKVLRRLQDEKKI